MTALKARHERFCRWFVELANAAGPSSTTSSTPPACADASASAGSGPAPFVNFCNGKKYIDFIAV